MKKILIVDDEHLIRYSLSAMLSDSRTEVDVAANGTEALAAVNEDFYDICFLDIHLPDTNGLDIMDTMRRTSPATKIIIMTGSEVNGAAMERIRSGAYLFVTKPFDLCKLKVIVEQVAEESENVYRDYESFVNWLAADRRQSERKAVMEAITYSVSIGEKPEGQHYKADVINISDTGMCISTDCRLEPGRVVKVDHGKMDITGVVRWSNPTEQESLYRAGIQFL